MTNFPSEPIGIEYTPADIARKQVRWGAPQPTRDNHIHARMYNDIKSSEVACKLVDAGFTAVPNSSLMEWKRIDDGIVCYITIDEQGQSAYLKMAYVEYLPSKILPSGTRVDEDIWTALIYNGASLSDVLCMPWPGDNE